MFYLLQTQEESQLDLEVRIVEDLLKYSAHSYYYAHCSKENIDYFVNKKAIPVGDIDFVTKYLQKAFNFEGNMFPLEIPKCLRTDEFLGRKYEILTSAEIGTLSKKYFIKNVSKLKDLACTGSPETVILPKDQLFSISEIIDIVSEYRVYVYDDKIVSIANYAGDPTIFPNVSIIKKMIATYTVKERKRPKAYTLDIAVTFSNQTLILEVHNFVSCGLYSTIWGTDLLNMYTAGIDYVLDHNHIIEK